MVNTCFGSLEIFALFRARSMYMPLQGKELCKLTIILFLSWNALAAPPRHRLKRMDTSLEETSTRKQMTPLRVSEEKELSKDDGEEWYPAIEITNEYYSPDDEPKIVPSSGSNSEDNKETNTDFTAEKAIGDTKKEESQNTTDNLTSVSTIDEDWVKAIRELFMKWGYKIEDIPEPFGSKKTSEMDAPSPEFSLILKGLEDSIPSNLKAPIENIIKLDGVNDGNGKSSGNMTKLEEIEETIKEIEAGLTKETPETHDLSHGNNNDITNGSSEDFKKDSENTHKDHTRFCAEYEGPCPEEGDGENDEGSSTNDKAAMGLSSNEENISDKEKLSSDQHTIDELIEDLKSIIEKPKEMTSEDSSKATKDLNEISTLIHEVESIASRNIEKADHPCPSSTNSFENNAHNKVAAEGQDQEGHTATTEKLIQELLTSTVAVTTSTQSKEDFLKKEQEIAEEMKKSGATLDVSIVGNTQKEIGNHLGRIANYEREKSASKSHESPAEEKQTIEELFNQIDKEGDKQREKDLLNPDLHKQVNELHHHVGHVHKIHSLHHQKNVTGGTHEDLNKGSHESATHENQSKERSINSTSSSEEENKGKEESMKELKTIFNVEADEVSKINEAHEKHKEEMLNVIRKLKITGNTDDDQKRVKRIEELVEEIGKEHHQALELQHKLSEIANGNDSLDSLNNTHTEHGKRDLFSEQMESLKKIEASLGNNGKPSQYDTIIDETLHSKKIQSKGSKKHHDKDKSAKRHDHVAEEKHKENRHHGHELVESQQSHKAASTDTEHAPTQPGPSDAITLHNDDNDKNIPDLGHKDGTYNPQSHGQTTDASDSNEPSANANDGHHAGANGLNSHSQYEHAGQKSFLHPKFDEVALEPAEVNFNGGFHKTIDELKSQSANGEWPDSDLWPDESENDQGSNTDHTLAHEHSSNPESTDDETELSHNENHQLKADEEDPHASDLTKSFHDVNDHRSESGENPEGTKDLFHEPHELTKSDETVEEFDSHAVPDSNPMDGKNLNEEQIHTENVATMIPTDEAIDGREAADHLDHEAAPHLNHEAAPHLDHEATVHFDHEAAPHFNHEAAPHLDHEAPPHLDHEAAPHLDHEAAPHLDHEAAPHLDHEAAAHFNHEAAPHLDHEAAPHLDHEAAPHLDHEAAPHLDHEAAPHLDHEAAAPLDYETAAHLDHETVAPLNLASGHGPNNGQEAQGGHPDHQNKETEPETLSGTSPSYYNHENSQKNTETKSDEQGGLDIINLEEELKLGDDSDRTDVVLESLNNSPVTPRFPDISPENLEKIIKKQHEYFGHQSNEKASLHHHVEEHELPESDSSKNVKPYHNKLMKRRNRSREKR